MFPPSSAPFFIPASLLGLCDTLSPLHSPPHAFRPTLGPFPSGLADPGLRHILVLEVLNGEAFVRRALLDAST